MTTETFMSCALTDFLDLRIDGLSFSKIRKFVIRQS